MAAAPAVGVTVTRTTTGGAILGARLNGKPMAFNGNEAHAVVGAGQTNQISWAVVGPAGSSYTIEVTEPADAGCKSGTKLGNSGKDAGICAFTT